MRSLAVAATALVILLVGHTQVAAQQNPPAKAAPPEAKTTSPFDDPSIPNVRPGEAGFTAPVVAKLVRPKYPAAAQKAKIEGVVRLECIVKTDGRVGDVRVTQSLDRIFGLDDEAIKAVKKWTFKPGRRNDRPIPVIIPVTVTFSVPK